MSERRRKPQKRQPREVSREDPTPQVGRRPSPPALLFAIAGMWIAVGVIAFVVMSAAWKLVPAIVFIGIGLLYLRGAVTTVARRGER